MLSLLNHIQIYWYCISGQNSVNVIGFSKMFAVFFIELQENASYFFIYGLFDLMCRSAYHQLRQLRPVVRSLSVDAAKTAVQSFVSTRMDYCNSLMYGIADGLMQRLQAVQNAAELASVQSTAWAMLDGRLSTRCRCRSPSTTVI